MRGPVHQGAEQHPPDPEYLLSLLISEPDLKAPISFNRFLNDFRKSVDLIVLFYHDSDLELGWKVKNLFLISKLNLSSFCLKSLPLILSLHSMIKSPSSSFL